MNVSFYTAAVGASEQQQRLNVLSNNVANVNTYGFKAKSPTFSSLMYDNMNGIDNTQLPRGNGAYMSMASTNFDSGALMQTGRAHDYAIVGNGFFGLVDPASGEVSYTRDGSFTLSGFQRPDENGVLEQVLLLSDGLGRFVLGEDGSPIEVSDQEPEQPIAVYTFANTNGMLSQGSSRFIPVEKNGAAILVENPTVQQGMLETSNTDLGNEIARLLEAQRSYSYSLRMLQTSDEVTTIINNLRNT